MLGHCDVADGVLRNYCGLVYKSGVVVVPSWDSTGIPTRGCKFPPPRVRCLVVTSSQRGGGGFPS